MDLKPALCSKDRHWKFFEKVVFLHTTDFSTIFIAESTGDSFNFINLVRGK